MIGRSRRLIAGLVTVVALVAFMTVGAFAGEREGPKKEQKLALKKVPPKVRATIARALRGLKIKEIERKVKEGKAVYKVEALREGREVELVIAPNGKVLARKVEERGKREEKAEKRERGERKEKAEKREHGERREKAEKKAEKALSLKKVPPAVRKTLARLVRRAKIAKIEKEEGLFEAKWEAEEVCHEAKVAPDGSLVELEETVAVKRLPKAVQRVARKLARGKKGLECEKKVIIIFELSVRDARGETEYLVSPTGKVLKRVVKKKEREKEEKGERRGKERERERERERD